jgi:hypothetical protein
VFDIASNWNQSAPQKACISNLQQIHHMDRQFVQALTTSPIRSTQFAEQALCIRAFLTYTAHQQSAELTAKCGMVAMPHQPAQLGQAQTAGL